MQQNKVKIYGTKVKGPCPSEEVEMASFFNRLRREYPDSYGAIALHIRNEGKRTDAQTQKLRANGGFVKGASDIVIPGSPSFVCEMKSRSKSARLSPGQVAYLEAAASAGAFVCVALGAAAAWEAFDDWLGSSRNCSLSAG
jgi:hypothetical protein